MPWVQMTTNVSPFVTELLWGALSEKGEIVMGIVRSFDKLSYEQLADEAFKQVKARAMESPDQD